jgi:regulator of protease activity HflC (stomatin/prohibitin superfamily)
MQSMNSTGVEENVVKTRRAKGEEDRAKRALALERRRAWRRRWLIVKYGTPLLIGLIVAAGTIFVFRKKMLVTVDSGEVAVYYNRLLSGTQHNNVFGEGLHVIFPWDRVYKYSIRTQTIVKPMAVLTKNGLEVKLDAQIRFHPVPEIIASMHRRLGPDYVNTTVIPQLSEAVQRVIGQFMPEDIYSSSGGNGLFEEDKRIIGGVYIQVEQISLFNVRLPDKVQASIQAKAEQQQAVETYKFKVQQEEQEFKRREKEIEGLKEYADIRPIPKSVLVWKGIEATLELAKSPNAKVIVFGSKDNLPLMLGNVPDVPTDDAARAKPNPANQAQQGKEQ